MSAAEKVRDEAFVSRETKDRLQTYSDLILRWTGRINLVARADATPEALWQRHIEDAAQLLPLVPPGVDRAIDLGSGAGLPGMVIAIARPDIQVTMIEADRRKAAFLQTAAAELGLRATVVAARIEAAAVVPASLVTARALARLPALLGLAAPLLAPGGVCLLPKGRGVDAELTEAARGWQMTVERFPSRTDTEAAILRISGLRRAI